MFLPVRSVGVQGDQRTHSHVVALRAVTSQDGMTADWYAFICAAYSVIYFLLPLCWLLGICQVVRHVNITC